MEALYQKHHFHVTLWTGEKTMAKKKTPFVRRDPLPRYAWCTIDAVGARGAIGNSQYFWWILLLLGFFVPTDL